jgi:hypothetical protein
MGRVPPKKAPGSPGTNTVSQMGRAPPKKASRVTRLKFDGVSSDEIPSNRIKWVGTDTVRYGLGQMGPVGVRS